MPSRHGLPLLRHPNSFSSPSPPASFLFLSCCHSKFSTSTPSENLPPPPITDHVHARFWFGLSFGVGGSFSLLLFFLILLVRACKLRWNKQGHLSKGTIRLRKFAYQELKAATQGFSSNHKLGQGGFGVVYKGVLKGGQEIAVKKLDKASFQGEREFQNELSVIGHVSTSPLVVALIGFCLHGKKRLLVYKYMHNRSLQEALFEEDYPEQLNWEKRFNIIVDTSKALAFLHSCEPPIIHGDIKPSNVLLDANFHARMADFGLARFKTGGGVELIEREETLMYASKRRSAGKQRRPRREPCITKLDGEDSQGKHLAGAVTQGVEGSQNQVNQKSQPVRKSTSSVFTTSPDSDASSSITGKAICDSPSHCIDISTVTTQDSVISDSDNVDGDSPLPDSYHMLQLGEADESHTTSSCVAPAVEHNLRHSEIEKVSTDSGKELDLAGATCKEKQKNGFGKDWWWRQESSGELSVKDYVLDWMGHESKRELPMKDGKAVENLACGRIDSMRQLTASSGRRDHSKSSEWWGGILQEAVDSDAKVQADGKKNDKGRSRDSWHWWKEDHSGPLESSSRANDVKQKDSWRGSWRSASLEWWRDDTAEDGGMSAKSKRSCHKERPRSREWWKDDDLANSSKEWRRVKKKREHSLSREWSGELSSRKVGSIPSMRGTICYIAPENSGAGMMPSEKSDVYSFGVLLLVIISGRRPLQVMASPINEFERANLTSWARHLAQTGNVLELVDPALHDDFCRKQAALSITVALLCLQRLPSKRPTMNEVLRMLCGELDAPSLPLQLSPSPPCRVPYRP